jgi:hypothetical protein
VDGEPEQLHLGEQLDVGIGHVQALQRVEHGFEARHGVVAGLRGRQDQQAAVDVGLLGGEGMGALVEGRLVGVRGVRGGVEVALGVVELLLEQAVLRVDGGQQAAEGVEVGGRLQLVVEIVGHARLRVVGLHGGRVWVQEWVWVLCYAASCYPASYAMLCSAMLLGGQAPQGGQQGRAAERGGRTGVCVWRRWWWCWWWWWRLWRGGPPIDLRRHPKLWACSHSDARFAEASRRATLAASPGPSRMMPSDHGRKNVLMHPAVSPPLAAALHTHAPTYPSTPGPPQHPQR